MSRIIALNIAIIGIIYLVLSYFFKLNETFTEGMAPIPKSLRMKEYLEVPTPILSPIIFDPPVVSAGTFSLSWSSKTAPGVTILYDVSIDQIASDIIIRDALGNQGSQYLNSKTIFGTTSSSIRVTGGALWPGIILTITVKAYSKATSSYKEAVPITNSIKVNPTPTSQPIPMPTQQLATPIPMPTLQLATQQLATQIPMPTLQLATPVPISNTPPPPPNPLMPASNIIINNIPNSSHQALTVWIKSDNLTKLSNNVISTIPNNSTSGFIITPINSPTLTTDGILLGNMNILSSIPSLTTNYTFKGNETIFVVMKIPHTSSGVNVLSGNFSNTNYGTASRTLWFSGKNSYHMNFKYMVTNYGKTMGPYQGQSNASNVSSLSTMNNFLISTTISNTGLYSFTNGAGGLGGGYAQLLRHQPGVDGGTATIAPLNDTNSVIGQGTQMYLSEMLIYNSELPINDRQRIEGYLAKKWNLLLPTTHPFYFIPSSNTLMQPNTPPPPPNPLIQPIPDPPTNITATNITMDTATISWAISTNKASYTVSTTPSTNTPPTLTGLSSVNLTRLSPSTTYYFNINFIDTLGRSSRPTLFSFSTSAIPPINNTLRRVLDNINITKLNQTTCSLMWFDNNNPNVRFYYYTLYPPPLSPQPNTGLAKTVTYTNLLPNTNYKFTIISVYVNGSTAPVSKLFSTPPPPPDTNITASVVPNNNIPSNAIISASVNNISIYNRTPFSNRYTYQVPPLKCPDGFTFDGRITCRSTTIIPGCPTGSTFASRLSSTQTPRQVNQRGGYCIDNITKNSIADSAIRCNTNIAGVRPSRDLSTCEIFSDRTCPNNFQFNGASNLCDSGILVCPNFHDYNEKTRSCHRLTPEKAGPLVWDGKTGQYII